jgi:hypothetical protein
MLSESRKKSRRNKDVLSESQLCSVLNFFSYCCLAFTKTVTKIDHFAADVFLRANSYDSAMYYFKCLNEMCLET